MELRGDIDSLPVPSGPELTLTSNVKGRRLLGDNHGMPMAERKSSDSMHGPFRASGQPVSKQAHRFRLYFTLLLIDVLSIFTGFYLAGLLRHNEVFGASGTHLALLVIPIYLLVALNSQAYGYQVLANWTQGLNKAMMAFVFSVATVHFVAFYAHASLDFSRIVSGVGFLAAGCLLAGGRYAFKRIVGNTAPEDLRDELIIADNCEPIASGSARVINAAAYDLKPNLRDPQMLDRLGTLVRGADYVLVCCAPQDRAVWSLLLKGTDVQGYVIAPEFDEVGANRLERYHGQCVMQVASGPLDIRSRIIKRTMDLAVTIPMIVLLSPLLLLVAILIKLDSRGPVMFRQARMGRGNRMFQVLKFRSMHVSDCDDHGKQSATRGDSRITRVGRIIRATSIDELPQLFNVLNGEMSLVGPRPHALGSMAGYEHFWDVDERYWHRHSLKPGITGLAQIRGLRGTTFERTDLIHRLQADLEYLNNWSLWGDIVILAATVRVVIHPNAF